MLVVDDDLALREALRDSLTDEGYLLAEASDGTAALAYLRANPRPALILLDWNMAPMNGAQFMSEMVKDPVLAEIPVVLLTADARIREKTLMYRFAASLKKPVDLDALFAVVGRYCA